MDQPTFSVALHVPTWNPGKQDLSFFGWGIARIGSSCPNADKGLIYVSEQMIFNTVCKKGGEADPWAKNYAAGLV